ncbi:MAG: hypothetical protein JXR68_03800 [Bacteroidales bacterium]|nr:hypothetical protein [Bacteroidales bacterium]
MKTVFIFYLFFIFSVSIYGQIDTIYGKAYRNVVDYKNDKPLFEEQCIFKEYKKTSVNKNTYKLKVKNRKFKRRRQMNIWIITDGEYLYFNAKRHAFDAGFIKFKLKGNFYYFRSWPMLTISQKNKLSQDQFNYGLIGRSYTYSKIQSENQELVDNVLDLSKGQSSVLNEKYMLDLLENYPVLLNEFLLDTNTSDVMVLREYLDKVNELF